MIEHFTQLDAWKVNHEFVKLAYKYTQAFPSAEQFGITSQLRRAASSITANIAEGMGRYYMKDRIRFYYQARGSNTESQNHLILAFDLGYLTQQQYNELKLLVFRGFQLICGLIRSAEKQV